MIGQIQRMIISPYCKITKNFTQFLTWFSIADVFVKDNGYTECNKGHYPIKHKHHNQAQKASDKTNPLIVILKRKKIIINIHKNKIKVLFFLFSTLKGKIVKVFTYIK